MMDATLSGSNLVYILPKQPRTTAKPVIAAALSKPLAKIAPLTAPAKCTGTPPLKPPKREREEDNEILRCKRRLDFAKLGLPMHKQNPVIAARRNERERKRVKYINETFDVLKEHLPDAFQAPKVKNKEMSKVEILRGAIDYITTLEDLLTKTAGVDFEGDFAALIQASDSVNESLSMFGQSTESYPGTPDPVSEQNSTDVVTPSGQCGTGTVMGNPGSVMVNPVNSSFPTNPHLLNVMCTPSGQLPGTPSGHSSVSGTPVSGRFNQSLTNPATPQSRPETPSSSRFNFNIQVNQQSTPSQHINVTQMMNHSTPSHPLPQLIPSQQQMSHQVPQNMNSYTQQTFGKDQLAQQVASIPTAPSTNNMYSKNLPKTLPNEELSRTKGDFSSNLLNNNNCNFLNNNNNPVTNNSQNSNKVVNNGPQSGSYTLNLDCGYMPNLAFTPDMPSPALSGYAPSLCSPAPSIASVDKVTENVDFTDLTSLLMGFDC